LIAAGIPYELYFPKFHGVIDTDLGLGICVDLLKGTDGKLPLILKQALKTEMLQDREVFKSLKEQYQDFAAFCERHLILSASAGFENIGIIQVDGAPRIVSFDVKSITSKQLIPIINWSSTLKRKRIRRRFLRCMAMLDAMLPA
jgi:hypothetical protein